MSRACEQTSFKNVFFPIHICGKQDFHHHNPQPSFLGGYNYPALKPTDFNGCWGVQRWEWG